MTVFIELTRLIETIAIRWNTGLANQAAAGLIEQFWLAGGSADEELAALIDRLRDVLKAQLAVTAPPVEQLRVMEISYRLEQGLANRGAALSLAKNIRHLAERRTEAMQQVGAAALLAEAWYLAGAIPFALDWSRRTLQTAKPLVVRGHGGRPVLRLYAEQETQLALCMALQGGAAESVEKLLADAVRRYRELNISAGCAAAMGIWSQAELLLGRWQESVDKTREALAIGKDLPTRAPLLTGLWAGARSAARLGETELAGTWAREAAEACKAAGDIIGRVPVLMAAASAAWSAGQQDAALDAADRAAEWAGKVHVKVLRRWALLERAWLHLAIGRTVDPDKLRATVESLAKSEAGPLAAEAEYALYHALIAAGRDGSQEYEHAREQFAALGMQWHLERLEAKELLTSVERLS